MFFEFFFVWKYCGRIEKAKKHKISAVCENTHEKISKGSEILHIFLIKFKNLILLCFCDIAKNGVEHLQPNQVKAPQLINTSRLRSCSPLHIASESQLMLAKV